MESINSNSKLVYLVVNEIDAEKKVYRDLHDAEQEATGVLDPEEIEAACALILDCDGGELPRGNVEDIVKAAEEAGEELLAYISRPGNEGAALRVWRAWSSTSGGDDVYIEAVRLYESSKP